MLLARKRGGHMSQVVYLIACSDVTRPTDRSTRELGTEQHPRLVGDMAADLPVCQLLVYLPHSTP